MNLEAKSRMLVEQYGFVYSFQYGNEIKLIAGEIDFISPIAPKNISTYDMFLYSKKLDGQNVVNSLQLGEAMNGHTTHMLPVSSIVEDCICVCREVSEKTAVLVPLFHDVKEDIFYPIKGIELHVVAMSNKLNNSARVVCRKMVDFYPDALEVAN